ncbi:UDP-glucose/GDP-mannose dehydrogenase family protein [Rossellomorea vietnamensis]|uniref:UDP-glucose 6-dehydrogenase n=1 Tax=Rossellomorea vietnamensis TaxID=218284 RepID=A0A5D4M3L1_9BACI|nr:UDP-glucose/GDP-mannose dehydrogenase family protein [Rossellomorea vietnamensis]TYR95893.1 UDP-glucose/GDP-mannose dehydrogenase family protein [Rossellomorea vietnamensis]
MNISVIGTGYVGLVTGVCLAQVGYRVTCIDTDENKIGKLKRAESPIYEPGIEEMLAKNLEEKRLDFSTDYYAACSDADVIFIAVGTPQHEDGSANLSYIQSAAENIGLHIQKDGVLIVTKSTVPVGTNAKVKKWLSEKLVKDIQFEIASNPEFLREGSAIGDTFEADRIVIGTETREAASKLEALYQPFRTTILKTTIESAEMIKYASNAFLATKISFINEIANLCEKLDADIDEVATGMGMDRRIGTQFLKAGIGYGGSCFPKDTNALVQIAGDIEHQFELLESVIRVNSRQQIKLVSKALAHFQTLKGKSAAILGLSFKPNTDDIREAAAMEMIKQLLHYGVEITVFDPVAMRNTRKVFGDQIHYAEDALEAVRGTEMAFIVTEWEEIRSLSLKALVRTMETPVVFDGRNCFSLDEAKEAGVTYYSIGRKPYETSRSEV